MSISKQITTIAVMMAVGFVTLSARPAFAVKQFYDEFKEVYGNLDASMVAKAKCNICHEGKSKKDNKNPEKIREALEKVAGMKSPSGKTWGEILKAGKLPE
jgi:ABC-type branched-subunit amino acid transport system substrate-binding protein